MGVAEGWHQNNTARVVLADDHQALLDAMEEFLEANGVTVIGTATDGRTALSLAHKLGPDVMVMDIGMPGMNGIEAMRRLRAEKSPVKVVCMSAHVQRQYVREMLDAGAAAYVSKLEPVTELVRSIQAVMKGQKYLSPEIAKVVVDSTGHHPMPGVPQLGPREREVLQLIAEGDTSPMIAERLFISPSTVDVHRRNIMKKLDLHSVAELTKYAVRQGYTTLY